VYCGSRSSSNFIRHLTRLLPTDRCVYDGPTTMSSIARTHGSILSVASSDGQFESGRRAPISSSRIGAGRVPWLLQHA